MWERGLKPVINLFMTTDYLSLPMWERGLKPKFTLGIATAFVAPHVGAWIETDMLINLFTSVVSLPMWERGLKLLMVRCSNY